MKIHYLYSLLAILCFAACNTDALMDIDGIKAEPSIAIPIGSSEFTIGEYIADDSLFSVDNNGLVSVTYREDSVAQLDFNSFIADFLDSWTAEYNYERNVGPIQLDDVSNEGSASLGQFANSINDPVVRSIFVDNDGGNATIPAFSEIINESANIAVYDNFEYVNIVSGELEITVENGFGFPLQDLEVAIYDNLANTEIGRVSMAQLNTGEIKSETLDLANKRINNDLSVKVPLFKSPGTAGPILIDLSEILEIKVKVKAVVISNGKVKIPKTNLGAATQFIDFQTSGDEKLKVLALEGGIMSYNLRSDLNIPMELTMGFPGTVRNGQPVNQNVTFTGQNFGNFNYSNTIIRLDEDPDQDYNRFEVSYDVEIMETNNLVEVDSSDKIEARIHITDLSIEEVIGYFGQFSQRLDSSTLDFGLDFSIFEDDTKALFFKDPSIKVFYDNSFGFPVEFDFHLAADGKLGNDVQLNPALFALDFPPLAQKGQSVSNNYTINKQNSEIVDVLSIFPKSIEYGGLAALNANGVSFDNHANKNSRIKVGFEMDLPLSFNTENLSFLDTLSDEALGEDLENVQNAELKIDYTNSLPFTTTIDLLGANEREIPIVIFEDLEVASPAIQADGSTIAPKSDRIELILDKTQILNLFNKKYLIVRVQFQTGTDGLVPVNVYTDSGLDLAFGLKADLEIEE